MIAAMLNVQAGIKLLALLVSVQRLAQAKRAAPDTPQRRGKRGQGCVFKRTGSKFFHIRYYVNGVPRQEPTGTTSKEEAGRMLRERLGSIAKGEPIVAGTGKLTVNELLDGIRDNYTINGQRLDAITPNIARLREQFGRWRGLDVTTAALEAYIARCRANTEAPLSNATLNRDMAVLRRAFNLARRGTPPRIATCPVFPMLKEAAPRKGFFEREQFESVCRHLPQDLQDVVRFEYITGWRSKSEVYPLTWPRVDFEAGVVRLEVGETKNDDGRVFPFAAHPELGALLRGRWEKTQALQRKLGRVIPHVFHRNGRPIRDFRGAWRTACEKAGVPGRIQHDFRRTAVRNLERAGVPRSVAMKLTGHKTEAVYRRYAIVAEADLAEGVTKLAALHASATRRLATGLATVAAIRG